MMDFTAALDTRAGDVQKPPVLPQGTYTWTVIKVPAVTEVKSAKGEWDVVEFAIRATSAEDDVDWEELEEFGSLNSAISRVSFMFPRGQDKEADRVRTQNRLKKFLLETLRVDGNEDNTLKELLSSAVNSQFLARCKWRQVEDETYFDVADFMPLMD